MRLHCPTPRLAYQIRDQIEQCADRFCLNPKCPRCDQRGFDLSLIRHFVANDLRVTARYNLANGAKRQGLNPSTAPLGQRESRCLLTLSRHNAHTVPHQYGC
ncbi:Uncharacterised protein [Vibrio cholerae]|nr:Uncharacterised protein [Vibrio cholerae]